MSPLATLMGAHNTPGSHSSATPYAFITPSPHHHHHSLIGGTTVVPTQNPTLMGHIGFSLNPHALSDGNGTGATAAPAPHTLTDYNTNYATMYSAPFGSQAYFLQQQQQNPQPSLNQTGAAGGGGTMQQPQPPSYNMQQQVPAFSLESGQNSGNPTLLTLSHSSGHHLKSRKSNHTDV